MQVLDEKVESIRTLTQAGQNAIDSSIKTKSQVVDKNDLYKRQKKPSPDKVTPDKSSVNGKPLDLAKTLSSRERREKFKSFQEKLKVSDVVKAVMDSYDESSSSISSVSSLTDSELDSDTDTHKENLKVAMEKLREAREKKIQMSLQKKKGRQKLHGDGSGKSRKSLDMSENEQKHRKKEKTASGESSNEENLSLNNDSTDTLQERLKSDKSDQPKKQLAKKMKRTMIKDDQESDSGSVRVNKSDKQDKNNLKFKKKKELEEKVKKKKRKRVVIETDTDSESETEVKRDKLRRKKIAKKAAIQKEILVNQTNYEFSNSDDETLDKIAAKSNMKKAGSSENKSNTSAVPEIKSDVTEAVKAEMNTSEAAKKELNTYSKTDFTKQINDKTDDAGGMEMEFFITINTGLPDDSPNKRRKSLEKGRVKSMEGPSESDTTGTPNVKSSQETCRKSPGATPGKNPSATPGKSPGATPPSANKDSESSTGDTPLIKKCGPSRTVNSSVFGTPPKTKPTDRSVFEDSPHIFNTKKAKKLLDYDSDSNHEDIPKVEISTEKNSNENENQSIPIEDRTENDSKSTESKKRKHENAHETEMAETKKKQKLQKGKIISDSDSELSTGDTPLIKKKITNRKKIEHSDGELSTGDTPLIKKKLTNKKKTVQSVASTGDTPLTGKKVGKKVVKKVEYSDDELSSDDIPLVKIKSSIKKTPNKIDHESDSEVSTGDTPLIKTKRKTAAKIVSDEDKDTDSSTGYTPLAKKKGKKDIKTEVELASKSDTHLIKKKAKFRRTSTDSRNSDKSNSSAKSSSNKSSKKRLMKSRTEQVKVSDIIIISEDTSQDEKTILKSNSSRSKVSEQELAKVNSGNSESGCDKDNSPVKKGGRKSGTETVVRSDGETLVKKRRKSTSGLIVSSESETSDEAKMVHTIGSSLDSDWDSDDWDVPLSKISKLKKEGDCDTDTMSDTMSRTGDDDKKPAVQESTSLRLLRKICRECRLFVRNDRELKDCHSEEQKIARCMELLRQAGMKGKPSLRKAEEVKLKKEAAELSADNVISSETGRVMRKVKSIYARRQISPMKPAKRRGKNPFSNLTDVVDSEGSPSK